MYSKLDLAADEPADPQWTPVDRTAAPGTPLAPEAGGRYRVLFPANALGFYNRACYSVETLTPATVQLRGYGRVFTRGELTFLAL